MTTYYISPTDGLDSNNGLGPDASAAVNRPWKTLAKALASGTTVVTGDTVYVGPGISYEGAAITVVASVFSNATPTFIRGDPTNSQGFKTAAGVRIDPGLPWITTRTAAEGQDAPMAASGNLIDASAGVGKGGLQFTFLALETQFAATGASIFALNGAGAGNSDWLFEDCVMVGAVAMSLSGTLLAARNVTFRRCEMLLNVGTFAATIAGNPATADIDLAILFEHCIVRGRASNAFSLAGAGGNLAGGIRWKYCDFYASNVQTSTVWSSTASRVSTVVPCEIEGCKVFGGIIVSAGTLGHFVSKGYNRFFNGGTDVNYTPAVTDVYGFMPLVRFASLVKFGLELPHEAPFGWLASATGTQRMSGGVNTSPDFRGRTPRPWAMGPSIGAWEVGEIGLDLTSQITIGGASSLAIMGQGELSVFVPLDGVAVTLTVATKSTAYVGTSYPQVVLQAQPSLGLTQQTATATDATQQTLTITVTPTAAGVVELRLISRNAGPTGWTYFDILQAA